MRRSVRRELVARRVQVLDDVLDFLAVAATDVVALKLKDEVSQAVMTPVGAEGYDYTYVIMPMRI